MSFIVVQKFPDMVMFISDTFSEGFNQSKTDWFLNPTVKIIKIRSEWVVAYAGSIDTAQAAFIALMDKPTLDVVEYLAEINNCYPVLSKAYAEFAICNISELSLVVAKDGNCQSCSAGYLGSKTAMEIYQSKKLRNGTTLDNITTMSAKRVPEGVHEKSSLAYGINLEAFTNTMLQTDRSFGGVALPYVVSKEEDNFMDALQNTRGPIEQYEFGDDGSSAISHQDSIAGGYIVIVSGGGDRFSIHYPNGNCGCIYKGFGVHRSLAVDMYRDIDPYDFTYIAGLNGIERPISTWESIPNHRWKILKLIEAGEMERAELLAEDAAKKICHSLIQFNPEVKIQPDERIIQILKRLSTVVTSIDLINSISMLMEIEIALTRAKGDINKENDLRKYQITWSKYLTETKFSMSYHHQDS